MAEMEDITNDDHPPPPPLLLLNRQGWKRLANDKNIERQTIKRPYASCYANEVEEAEEEAEQEDQEEEKRMRRKRRKRRKKNEKKRWQGKSRV
jgi:hypothetical protein